MKPYYDRQDVLRDEPAPGVYPYTRGIRARARGGWIQRGLSGEGDPEHSNAQLKTLIANGQTGIDVIGDSPTMALLDPDHPLAAHAVGAQGVSLCCVDDYRALLADLPLGTVSVSSSVPAPFFMAGLVLVARERGIDLAQLRGSVLQAPFYAEDCGYEMQMPFALRLRLACDSIAYSATHLPRYHCFLEDTYFFSEVGLTPVEEMALGFVEIRYVVRELLSRGVDIDRFAPRIALLVNCSMSLLREVAKIRASRRLFAQMMRDEFGAKDPRSLAVVIASHTSGRSMTAQQPVNNVVRGALQAMALVMAGVQAIEISAFDEAYRIPSAEAHLVGLRTQQILELETDVAEILDPLGGSFLIERMTDELEREIRELVAAIERRGDPGALCDSGFFSRMFADAMIRSDREISSGSKKQVGVNVHRVAPEDDRLLRDVVESRGGAWRERIASITRHKRERPPDVIEAALQALGAAASDRSCNLMPPIIDAMASGITVGEIAHVLRAFYGARFRGGAGAT
jgi:methylmalonyl-CoA mutase N-terminal domain/subunit